MVHRSITGFAATDEEDWSNSYPISEKYRESFENIVPRWRVAPLPAYDTNGKFIKFDDLEVSLRGSLVLVYFEVKHYAIRDRRSNVIGTNTFSATATQVKILERGAVRSASYRSLMLKGPKTLPQSPTKRKDQASAAHVFHPGTVYLPFPPPSFSPFFFFPLVFLLIIMISSFLASHLKLNGSQPSRQVPTSRRPSKIPTLSSIRMCMAKKGRPTRTKRRLPPRVKPALPKLR